MCGLPRVRQRTARNHALSSGVGDRAWYKKDLSESRTRRSACCPEANSRRKTSDTQTARTPTRKATLDPGIHGIQSEISHTALASQPLRTHASGGEQTTQATITVVKVCNALVVCPRLPVIGLGRLTTHRKGERADRPESVRQVLPYVAKPEDELAESLAGRRNCYCGVQVEALIVEREVHSAGQRRAERCDGVCFCHFKEEYEARE